MHKVEGEMVNGLRGEIQIVWGGGRVIRVIEEEFGVCVSCGEYWLRQVTGDWRGPWVV